MSIIAVQRAREVSALTGQVREVLAATTTRAARRTLAATVDRLAACAGGDPARWYPRTDDDDALADAIGVCEDCPVRARCLALEVATVARAEDIHGVRGGLTQGEARGVFRQVRAELAEVAA